MPKANDKPQWEKEQVLHDIYSGKATPERLPKSVYLGTAERLSEGIKKGYKALAGVSFDSPDLDMIEALRTNIYMFSAAKTFQETSDLFNQLVDEDGTVLSFSDFKKLVDATFDKYNVDWLEAEYNTTISASRSASKWVDIEKNKEDRPYLSYSAVMDEHTCDICAPLDGITLPVDDPFWAENGIPQHFNCECVLEQLDESDIEGDGVRNSIVKVLNRKRYRISTPAEVRKAVELSGKKKNPMFNYNPGRDKVIFKDTGKHKHPYFDVPLKYKHFAETNFGLKIPEFNHRLQLEESN